MRKLINTLSAKLCNLGFVGQTLTFLGLMLVLYAAYIYGVFEAGSTTAYAEF